MSEKEKLEMSANVIRGLISYHKRMLLACEHGAVISEGGKFTLKKKNNPETTFQKDVYLKAMETALQLIEEKILRISEK